MSSLRFRLEVDEEQQQRRDVMEQRESQIDGFIKEFSGMKALNVVVTLNRLAGFATKE